MYESGGEYGKSSFIRRDTSSHVSYILNKIKLKDQYFGEGLDFGGKKGQFSFFQLTW